MNNYPDCNYRHNTSYIVKIAWDKEIDSDICDLTPFLFWPNNKIIFLKYIMKLFINLHNQFFYLYC